MNKAIIMGRVGKDPVVRNISNSSNRVAQFSVATTRWYKKGEKFEEDTQWHTVSAWNMLADKSMDKIMKGARVLVEGHIVYEKYTGQDGLEKNFTKIVANSIEIIDKKQATPTDETNVYGREPIKVEDDPSSYDDLPF